MNPKAGALRPLAIEIDVMRNPEGSARIAMGETVVLCSASVDEKVPPFLKGTGKGWVTAEYSMLPRSTNERMAREAARGKQSGRTMEIQRLIGRALRAVVDLDSLGERTVIVDCDVLEADGGTRTASITGGAVALHRAFTWLVEQEKLRFHPMRELVAAVSVGIVGGAPVLDLCYAEDSRAQVDLNVVMTGDGRFVEVQGTAEESPFTPDELETMLGLARTGLADIHLAQRRVLGIAEGRPA